MTRPTARCWMERASLSNKDTPVRGGDRRCVLALSFRTAYDSKAPELISLSKDFRSRQEILGTLPAKQMGEQAILAYIIR